MTDLLNEIFIQNQYQKIMLNVPGICLNIKKTGESTFTIVTIDEQFGNIYTKEQFENISKQIRSFIANSDCTRYRFLYIIISDDDNSAKRLLNNDVSYWRIVPSSRQLMVFETSCDDFLTLRKPIENMLLHYSDNNSNNRLSTPKTEAFENNTSIFDKEINLRLAVVNIGIVIINVLVFVIISVLSPPGSDDISSRLALDWNLVINHGEYYRLLTCMFVHADIDHIYNNMIVLLFIGSYFELSIGRINYLLIYFSSGIIAGMTSMFYNMAQNNYVQSVGASGAIFGVIGGMTAVILIKYLYRHNMYLKKLDLKKIIFIAFLSLYSGFANQGTDNAAHIGGFISGFLISFVSYLIHRKIHHKANKNLTEQPLN